MEPAAVIPDGCRRICSDAITVGEGQWPRTENRGDTTAQNPRPCEEELETVISRSRLNTRLPVGHLTNTASSAFSAGTDWIQSPHTPNQTFVSFYWQMSARLAN